MVTGRWWGGGGNREIMRGGGKGKGRVIESNERGKDRKER